MHPTPSEERRFAYLMKRTTYSRLKFLSALDIYFPEELFSRSLLTPILRQVNKKLRYQIFISQTTFIAIFITGIEKI